VQLAVFEAVNSITGNYNHTGTIVAGRSTADAAAARCA
jgi:hypothetical protein